MLPMSTGLAQHQIDNTAPRPGEDVAFPYLRPWRYALAVTCLAQMIRPGRLIGVVGFGPPIPALRAIPYGLRQVVSWHPRFSGSRQLEPLVRRDLPTTVYPVPGSATGRRATGPSGPTRWSASSSVAGRTPLGGNCGLGESGWGHIENRYAYGGATGLTRWGIVSEWVLPFGAHRNPAGSPQTPTAGFFYVHLFYPYGSHPVNPYLC